MSAVQEAMDKRAALTALVSKTMEPFLFQVHTPEVINAARAAVQTAILEAPEGTYPELRCVLITRPSSYLISDELFIRVLLYGQLPVELTVKSTPTSTPPITPST